MSGYHTAGKKETRNGRLINSDYREGYAAGYHDAWDDLIRRLNELAGGTELLSDMHIYAAEQLVQVADQVDRAALVIEYVPDSTTKNDEDEEWQVVVSDRD